MPDNLPRDVCIPDLASPRQLDRLASVLDPLARVIQPKFYGADAIPERGVLLVGNHTIYGLLDLPFMMAELYKRRGITVRGLGEHAHYVVPVWRDVLGLCGMVRGTRENVHALMDAGENVLVFPGGAREVNKRRGEKYQLMWKERLGFARLAIEHGYPIVPFAAVGAEEMYDVILDEDNPTYAQFTGLVKKATGWPMQPLVRGLGPTLLPRPERLYFWFGDPIPTAQHDGHPTDQAARATRDAVKTAVESGIAFLHDERTADPDRGLLRRLRGRVES